MDVLLDTAPCGYLSFAEDGIIKRINATLLDRLGYQRDQVVGHSIEPLLNSDTLIFYRTHWLPSLQQDGRAAETFLTLRRETGEDVGMLSYTRRRDADGLFDCILVELRDCAHIRDDRERAASSFLAVMSHELRTPLNAIGGYLQILELGIAGPITEQQREILHNLERSSQHLLHMINDVLDLSRIEAGKIQYTISDVVLADVVAASARLVASQLAEKGIELRVDVPRQLVVRADPDKLRQVIGLLVGNAATFTPPGGQVQMHASRTDRAAELEISDTGIGIPSDKLEAIFQPFVQVDSAYTRSADGAGLGLAIGRGLARGMGGDITVHSTLGHGSTFTCRIPVRSLADPRTPERDGRIASR